VPKTVLTITFKPSLAQLQKKFGSIEAEKILGKGIKILAANIERESKQVSPVDTGIMRGSIRPVFEGNLRASIGPRKVNYAIFVHEGTRFMSARPFMVWGARSAVDGFDSELAGNLEAHIQSKIK